jgi:apolipoprotein N-acyltransferase
MIMPLMDWHIRGDVMLQAGSLVWLAVGACLFGVITRIAIPPMTWIAIALLLHASRSMPFGWGMMCMWLALYVALAIGERGLLPVSGPAYFAIVAFTATTVALPFAVDRLAAVRAGSVGLTMIFPLAWVATEFLRSRFAPPATWGSIAYTQYGYLPLMQVAAFIGIWGITFLIAWFASTFDLVWSRGFEWSVVRTPAVIYSAVLAAIVLAGTVRLAAAPTDRASIRATTLNRPVDLFVPGEMTRIAEGRLSNDERERMAGKLAQLHDWFLEGSRREARAGSRLIVFPEGNLLVFDEDEASFLERARHAAADEHVYLAIGMGTIHVNTPLPFENKLVLIDPSGQIVMSYLKSHAVVGWEASIMRVGSSRLPVIPTRDGRMAGAICFDADFPEFIRQAAEADADLLILPVNEWKEIKDIHLQMHAFRAIENGLPLVRAAASGLSTAFDPWGRMIGVADYFAPGDRTMTAQVPVGGVRTLYARTGDLFAWVCVAGVLMACVTAAFTPRMTSAERLQTRPTSVDAVSGLERGRPASRDHGAVRAETMAQMSF